MGAQCDAAAKIDQPGLDCFLLPSTSTHRPAWAGASISPKLRRKSAFPRPPAYRTAWGRAR